MDEQQKIATCPRRDGSGISQNCYGDMITCPVCHGKGKLAIKRTELVFQGECLEFKEIKPQGSE